MDLEGIEIYCISNFRRKKEEEGFMKNSFREILYPLHYLFSLIKISVRNFVSPRIAVNWLG